MAIYTGDCVLTKKADSLQYYTANCRLISNKFDDSGFMNSNYDCTLSVRPAVWLLTSIITPEERKRQELEVADKKYEADYRAWENECSAIKEKRKD